MLRDAHGDGRIGPEPPHPIHQDHPDPRAARSGPAPRPDRRPGTRRFPHDVGGRLDRRRREVVRLRFHDGLLLREIAELLGANELTVSRIVKDELARVPHAAGPDPQAA